MPTGVAIRDVREQLFAAAERVLQRAGVSALTSRAVTTEAGVAKGVLHKHFADFDDFLVELVGDRIARIDDQAVALRASAGTGTVTGNVAAVLADLFASVAVSIVALIIARDELRTRLRAAGLTGLPILTDAGAMLTEYLTAERALGRLAPDADVATLAPMLIGGTHLNAAGADGAPLGLAEIDRAVTAVLAGVLR